MKLFLCANVYTEKQQEEARECLSLLKSAGHLCALSAPDSAKLSIPTDQNAFSVSESDLIVSLGGDGAVLRAAQIAIAEGKPLVGINSGRLGFLCAMTLSEAVRFDEILASCKLSERALLEVKTENGAFSAVNDVAVVKKHPGSSVELSVSVENYGEFQIRGDGIVVATPTGSTAYNRSAGGPVIDPALDAVVITPLYPSRGADRSVVTGNGNAVTVTERSEDAVIVVDGSEVSPIAGGVEVRRSEKTLFIYTGKVKGFSQ